MSMQGEGAPFNGDTLLEQEFLRLKDEYKITTVIETGTYHGDTTKWLADNFDYVDTIEVNATYQKIAQAKLGPRANITHWTGSSADILIKVLEESPNNNLLVFLDAHWWKNPVLRELDQIAHSGLKPILVIHDFMNPNDLTMGYDTYPDQGVIYEWKWVEDKINKIYGSSGYIKYHNEQAVGARRGALFIIPII